MRPAKLIVSTAVICAAALSFATAGLAPHAAADSVVNGPVRIIDAAHPLPPIGAAASTSDPNGTTAVPVVPTETQHDDVVAHQEGLISPVPTPSDASSPPCTDFAGGDYIVTRFLWCNVINVGYPVLQGGKVIGQVSWTQVTTGTAQNGDRGVDLITQMINIVRTGTTTDGLLRVDWRTSGYAGSDGSNPACRLGLAPGRPTLLSQWQAGGRDSAYIYSDQSDGYGRDYVSRCGIASYDTDTGGTGGPFASGHMRSDSASYLPSSGGAVFDGKVPVFSDYSIFSSANGAVAQHIFDAQMDPSSTYPPKPGKDIPGSIVSGKPLTRLYPEWDATATAEYNLNRTVTQQACAAIAPQPPDPSLQCDEYPFASTWEGAGFGDGNFSVRYVDATQNSSAGGTLSAWYSSDRILHRDLFYVDIQIGGKGG
jgi:hypothetical protein